MGATQDCVKQSRREGEKTGAPSTSYSSVKPAVMQSLNSEEAPAHACALATVVFVCTRLRTPKYGGSLSFTVCESAERCPRTKAAHACEIIYIKGVTQQ